MDCIVCKQIDTRECNLHIGNGDTGWHIIAALQSTANCLYIYNVCAKNSNDSVEQEIYYFQFKVSATYSYALNEKSNQWDLLKNYTYLLTTQIIIYHWESLHLTSTHH